MKTEDELIEIRSQLVNTLIDADHIENIRYLQGKISGIDIALDSGAIVTDQPASTEVKEDNTT